MSFGDRLCATSKGGTRGGGQVSSGLVGPPFMAMKLSSWSVWAVSESCDY